MKKVTCIFFSPPSPPSMRCCCPKDLNWCWLPGWRRPPKTISSGCSRHEAQYVAEGARARARVCVSTRFSTHRERERESFFPWSLCRNPLCRSQSAFVGPTKMRQRQRGGERQERDRLRVKPFFLLETWSWPLRPGTCTPPRPFCRRKRPH